MGEVRIGSRGDSLVLTTGELDDSIGVTLRSERLQAETRPRDLYDLRGLVAYIADLADTSQAGWQGTKTWESLEGDIVLESQLREDRVTVTATLRSRGAVPANDGWHVHLDITIDPGEELRQFATDTHLLLSAD